jgi:hypothetical protein
MPENYAPGSPESKPEEGKLVEFPSDLVHDEEMSESVAVGHIETARQLKLIFTITIAVLAILLTAHFLYSLHLSNSGEHQKAGNVISDEIREEGTIMVGDKPLRGWFIDPTHEHFMSQDGRRFTYINPHEREGSTVNGYWRIMK